MNEVQRLELQQIRAEQRLLTARLAGLEQRLARFEAMDEPVAAPAVSLPPPLPPPLPVVSLPPPVPSISSDAMAKEPLPPEPPRATACIEPSPASAANPPPPVESLEMRIGGTWLVRVGIVLFLTFLAFLGSYLYENVVPHLGPAAKVGLLYLGAGALAGAGAWLERSRQARESGRVRQYARIVLAGGLAAVYYVTYAAHFYERLRVIPSPLLAGTLLLAWAAFMVWLAERRGSETLATVAILLAYYTSAINEGVAGFTLASNLFLSAGAVFLLRRHLWRVFPFASLLASFGSYAFWNYFHSYLGWRGLDTPPVHGGGVRFWTEAAFLLVYWLLFTWAAFTARDEALPPARRAGFASLNNGAFFLLTTWLLLGEYPHDFWRWSLGFGVVLLGLAETARRLPRRLDANTEGAYLSEGVLLVTLGFVTYFSGWQLSLVLAAQSGTLLAAAGWRRSRLLLAAAYGVGLLSFVLSLHRLAEPGTVGAWPLALSEGGFLVLAAWWGQRLLEKTGLEAPDTAPGSFAKWIAPAPAYFSLLGLAVWLWLIERQVTAEAWNAPVLALAAVALTASVYLLRVRAIPLYAQVYLLAAYVRWTVAYGGLVGAAVAPPIWNPLILLAATLVLGHWWQRGASGVWAATHERGIAGWNALLLSALLFAWLQPRLHGEEAWTAAGAGLSVVLFAYGLATGYRALAAAGQLLLFTSAVALLGHWQWAQRGYHPAMWLASGPWLAMLLTVVAVRRFLPENSGRAIRKASLGALYEMAAMGLFLVWGTEYFPLTLQFAFFALAGGLVFALAVWRRERRWLWLSAAPTLVSLAVFWLAYDGPDRRHWIHLLGVGGFAMQQWWGKRRLRDEPGWFPRPAQTALITAATLCAWALVTAGMDFRRGGTFTLAAAWSIYAAVLFTVGLTLRERPYRWLGLAVLASTLVRIAVVDIWQLNSGERVVSAFFLSIVLLGLGYLYNRYHDRWQNLL